MGVLARFRAVATRSRADIVSECRRCGTTVAPDADSCPECEGGDIARYRIP
jgi:uncharacterized OB-fold protein